MKRFLFAALLLAGCGGGGAASLPSEAKAPPPDLKIFCNAEDTYAIDSVCTHHDEVTDPYEIGFILGRLVKCGYPPGAYYWHDDEGEIQGECLRPTDGGFGGHDHSDHR